MPSQVEDDEENDNDLGDETQRPLLSHEASPTAHQRSRFPQIPISRSALQSFLSSRTQHYTILALVALDVLGILADIFITLYQCEQQKSKPHSGKDIWDSVRDGLGIAGLVFSCLFMVELALSICAFGWAYFGSSWFHCFDATVIVASFVIDVVLKGVVEEVASLVVILRLWRFFKIVEEFSVGAEEQLEGLEMRIEQLEAENGDLKRELKRRKGTLDEEEGIQRGSSQF